MVTAGRERPWWGPIDILFAVPFIVGVIIAGTVVASGVAFAVDGWDASTDLPVYGLFIAVVFQQAAQFIWPWIVSKRKGLGMASDWKFVFKWGEDIISGFGLAVACVLASAGVTWLVSTLIGLGEDEDPSNTSIISDNQDSPWLFAVILVVVIGAPLTEEVLFRGLILRALDKALGIYVALIGSTILFTLPHMQPGATGGETAVLMAGIATIGLILGLAVIRYDRLGPAIIGHFFFNAFGTTMALIGAGGADESAGALGAGAEVAARMAGTLLAGA